MHEPSKELFREINLDTADEVLEQLMPHRGATLWANYGEDKGWLFRGAYDAAWSLQPSAMRNEPLGVHEAGRVQPIVRTSLSVRDRLALEIDLVLTFATDADRAGFPLPGDSPELRSGKLKAEIKSHGFPPVEYRGLFALAQHYGVPTRLLDWTPRPLVAAYFAAADAAEKQIAYKTRRLLPERESDLCAIWALSRAGVWRLVSEGEPTVQIITAPAAQVPNLAAQAGHFTLVVYETSEEAEVDDPPNLDELFRGRQLSGDAESWCAPTLVKFTFPATDAPRMLYLLSFFDVTAATVFPGLAGVERAMFERTLMPRPAYRRDE